MPRLLSHSHQLRHLEEPGDNVAPFIWSCVCEVLASDVGGYMDIYIQTTNFNGQRQSINWYPEAIQIHYNIL